MSESDPKKPAIVTAPGSRDPSYPDRQRIDSDVRAFLREPSTPWIVFDKDSRVDREELRRSYLSAGAFILQSGRSSVVSAQEFATAPTAHAMPAVSDAKPEPSGLSVASDIDVPAPSPTVRPMSIDIEIDELDQLDLSALPGARRAKHTTWLAIASGATLFVVASVLALGTRAPVADANAKTASAAQARVTTVAPSRAAEEVPPPEPAVVDSTPAPSEDAKPAPADVKIAKKAEKADVKHSKFGRLVINGEARYKSVFFDGKRMLGKGTRSFAVLCGTHTIAVNDKSDPREIDVPCDGEYSVQR